MIAAAVAADLPALARLMTDSRLLQRYRMTYYGALTVLESALSNGDVILVSRTTSLDGFAWLSLAPRVLGGAAYLRLLLVAHPGQGLGSRLLLAAEDEACQRANHLYLLATTDNQAARRFYERRGYRYVGDLPGLVWPDLDEALYYKTLRSYAERLIG
jgi:ribosomal protein S18 acetylase RimI-like enzyme